jgi:hypothetical protein
MMASSNNPAVVLRDQGKIDEAEIWNQKMLERRKRLDRIWWLVAAACFPYRKTDAQVRHTSDLECLCVNGRRRDNRHTYE